MGFEFEIKKNGEYENKNPNWKAMDLNEEVKVKVLEFIKEGTATKGDKEFPWALFRFEINGEECSGFPPKTFLIDNFKKNVGTELTITKEAYKDKRGNDKIGFKIKGASSAPSLKMSNFKLKEGNLKDSGGSYDEKQALEIIKNQNRIDDESAYIELWTGYGETEDRAKEVFKHRKEV